MSAEPGSIGTALRLLRVCRRKDLKELSVALRVPASTLSCYELGKSGFPYLTVVKALRVMNLRHGAIAYAQQFALGLEEFEIEGADR